jgi:glutaredoxin
LATADYLALDAAGQVTCLYPFSVAPTAHTVVIAGQRRAAMCAIDALGVPAMFGRELAIAGCCADCSTPIALRVAPGTIEAVSPPAAMVVARRDEAAPAFAACCPFTVFVCGWEHAQAFAARITGAHPLPLPDTLTRAEEIFGGLPAETLPATRPRGRQWGAPAVDEPILYTQTGCAESARVRHWLTERGIPFIERNVSTDPEAAHALAATGTFATPLLVAGEAQALGFRPDALAALFAKRSGL